MESISPQILIHILMWNKPRIGFIKGLSRKQVNRALNFAENVKEREKQHITEDCVPFLINDSLNFKDLSFLTRKNLQLLYEDNKNKFFAAATFISLRSAKNWKSFELTSKVYPLEKKVDLEKCYSKSWQAFLGVQQMCTFESLQT